MSWGPRAPTSHGRWLGRAGSRCLLVGSGGGWVGSGGVEGGRRGPYNKRQDLLTPFFDNIKIATCFVLLTLGGR